MKTRLLLPLVVLLFALPTIGQMHPRLNTAAPMQMQAEQCRRDADSWGIPKWGAPVSNGNQSDEIGKFAFITWHDANLTFAMLNVRRTKLQDCEKADPTQAARYFQAEVAYSSAERGRFGDFVGRHNLGQQLYQEDETGAR